MSERWVEYDGKFINMAHVMQFDVLDGKRVEVCAILPVIDASGNASDEIRIGLFEDKSEAQAVIRAIIRGDYDVIRHPAYAQASASVEDVKKAIENDDLPF